MRHTFFATCGPGIEPVLHAECRALGLSKTESQVGGVRFEGTMEDARKACLQLRTAVRVRRWLARFPCADAEALYAGVAEIDWQDYVRPDGTLVVDALSSDSALTHTQFVEQRAKDAIVDQLRERTGVRPSVDKNDPDLRAHVHLFRDRATLAVDCGGASLHRRGWRRHQGLAPLAETYAAAIVLMSGWDQRSPLIDPFCGSGTILIEAALLAGGVAPGLFRERFGFESWSDHDARAWEAECAAARAAIAHPRKLRLIGRDLDPERVREARENVVAAGLEGRIELEVGDARELALKPGWNAWLVFNAPYGARVGEAGEIDDVLTTLGERLREEAAGYHVAALLGEKHHEGRLGLRGERTMLRNGSLRVRLYQAQV